MAKSWSTSHKLQQKQIQRIWYPEYILNVGWKVLRNPLGENFWKSPKFDAIQTVFFVTLRRSLGCLIELPVHIMQRFWRNTNMQSIDKAVNIEYPKYIKVGGD